MGAEHLRPKAAPSAVLIMSSARYPRTQEPAAAVSPQGFDKLLDGGHGCSGYRRRSRLRPKELSVDRALVPLSLGCLGYTMLNLAAHTSTTS